MNQNNSVEISEVVPFFNEINNLDEFHYKKLKLF